MYYSLDSTHSKWWDFKLTHYPMRQSLALSLAILLPTVFVAPTFNIHKSHRGEAPGSAVVVAATVEAKPFAV